MWDTAKSIFIRFVSHLLPSTVEDSISSWVAISADNLGYIDPQGIGRLLRMTAILG
ncbi:hypothetical protein ACS0TY_010546 [Phlomoides rotata]